MKSPQKQRVTRSKTTQTRHPGSGIPSSSQKTAASTARSTDNGEPSGPNSTSSDTLRGTEDVLSSNSPSGRTNMSPPAKPKPTPKGKKRSAPASTPRKGKKAKPSNPFSDVDKLMEDPDSILYSYGTDIKV